jgi:hypothetical protein
MTPPKDFIGVMKELDKIEGWAAVQEYFPLVAEALLIAVETLHTEESLCVPYMNDGDEERHRRILEAISRIKSLPLP